MISSCFNFFPAETQKFIQWSYPANPPFMIPTNNTYEYRHAMHRYKEGDMLLLPSPTHEFKENDDSDLEGTEERLAE
jgi:hypothetical protein